VRPNRPIRENDHVLTCPETGPAELPSAVQGRFDASDGIAGDGRSIRAVAEHELLGLLALQPDRENAAARRALFHARVRYHDLRAGPIDAVLAIGSSARRGERQEQEPVSSPCIHLFLPSCALLRAVAHETWINQVRSNLGV